MYLKNEEKEKISNEIKKLEQKSSCELVAVITKNSSSYWFFILTASLFVAAITTIIASTFNPNSIKFLEIVVLFFISSIIFLNSYKRPILALLPKEYKYKVASNRANSEFIKLGLHKTETREAIMFFVSIEERFVQIICDKNIKAKIDNTYWQKIVDEFILDVKKDEFSKGYIKAIHSCSELLIKEFPIEQNDENELSNEVIEL